MGICFGFWINDERIHAIPKLVLIFLFAFYYGHYLYYIIVSYRLASGEKKALDAGAYSLLRLLFYALLIIWIAYVLNLFDEFIPYIVGPILYTIVAYTISFVVIKKGYLKFTNQPKYKTTSVSEEQKEYIFSKALQLVLEEKQFKNDELTLKSLSEQLKVTPQTLSMVINQESKMNFNGFVNMHRIEAAIKAFQDPQYDHQTIASIAFEVGFNSISSFNTTFKKQQGITPLVFRKKLSE